MNTTTTITVEQSDSKRLERLAGDMSKKEYITKALDYFEKYGIDPRTHESPEKEMSKFVKRCDQVIAFIRKQESDILRPLCVSVNTTEQRIQSDIADLAKVSDFQTLKQSLQEILRKFEQRAADMNKTNAYNQSQIVQALAQLTQAQEQGLKELGLLIDTNQKTTFSANLAKNYEKAKRQ